MKWNIISLPNNQCGLEMHCSLLRTRLESLGHEVNVLAYNAPRLASMADRNLFVELVNPDLFRFAREQWLIPMAEWWRNSWNVELPKFRYVLCGTRHGYQIFKRKVGDRAMYLGMEPRDFFDPAIPRKRQFLHAVGGSAAKNTAAVSAAWRSTPAKLIVLSRMGAIKGPNIEFHTHVSESELHTLMNESLFHLMPSAMEGYGHSLHEAEAVGAVILTTDAPPMNEVSHDATLLIPPAAFRKHKDTTLTQDVEWIDVTAAGVAGAVRRALAMSDEKLASIQAETRRHFLEERDAFRARFAQLANSPIDSEAGGQQWPNLIPLPGTAAQPQTVRHFAMHVVTCECSVCRRRKSARIVTNK